MGCDRSCQTIKTGGFLISPSVSVAGQVRFLSSRPRQKSYRTFERTRLQKLQ